MSHSDGYSLQDPALNRTMGEIARKYDRSEANFLLSTPVALMEVNPENRGSMPTSIRNNRNRPAAKRDAARQFRIVLGLGHTLFAANLADKLRMSDHDVRLTAVPEMARRLAVRQRAHVLILPYLAHDPLLTAKIASATPRTVRVILVAESHEAERFAQQLAVEYAKSADGIERLLER
jgi:hypothetical protein